MAGPFFSSLNLPANGFSQKVLNFRSSNCSGGYFLRLRAIALALRMVADLVPSSQQRKLSSKQFLPHRETGRDLPSLRRQKLHYLGEFTAT